MDDEFERVSQGVSKTGYHSLIIYTTLIIYTERNNDITVLL